MSRFRDDLDLAADWVDGYRRRVGELPVAAQVEPGAIRAGLPASAPEQGEPFEAMLRDLDDVILPGITHWNHPRFFAWFANTGSEPGILAELLIASLNVNSMTWLSSPAATELEVTVLDWLAQLLGLPREWHGHIEDTASTATVAALAAARTLKPGGKIRIATPDIMKLARLLFDPDNTEVADYAKWALEQFPPSLESSTALTPCMVFNNYIRNWGHQFIYDHETLKALLTKAGFVSVHRRQINESQDPNLAAQEMRQLAIGNFANDFETMVLEATKSVQ